MKIHTFYKDGLQFIEISNDLNLKVVFSNLGASVFNIYFYNELMTRNVLNIKDYKNNNCYYGKTIGRTSNRIKGNKVTINNVEYELANNEGDNVLHGGKSGLSNQRFESSVNGYKDYTDVIYTYLSKHLESGYPGNLNIKVIYRIFAYKDEFEVLYLASSDMDTLLSLTNHTYFSLGDEDLTNMKLYIRGHKYLSVDKRTLLPKDIREVNEIMDFTKYKNILKDIDSPFLKGKMMNGYDNFYYFDEVNINNVNVSLRNKKYRLDIKTDFEGTQIYSSNYKVDYELNSQNNSIRDSVAIEPSDSYLSLPILLKNQDYKRRISYRFIKLD